MNYEEKIKATVQDIRDIKDLPDALFVGAARGMITGLIEVGRVSVLRDFDNMCKADGFIGFSDQEWQAIKRFFEWNKQITGWDNPESV